MSDIHQEWHELRQKNGDFICHLDGEMAKLEKKQVELKRRDQLQDLTDAGAFAMQFVTPPPFNCCQDDRDILKALNKAQADRIKTLEKELLALNEQLKVDLAVKKDLDEKLDKAAADYKALWIERDNLAETISRMEKTIRDINERNETLRERLAGVNASLKRSIQENSKLRSDAAYIDKMNKAQEKEIERFRTIVNATNGSSSIYTQQGMQSKIAKQANEIKRLTGDIETLNEKLNEQTGANERLTVAYDKIYNDNKFLQRALETSAEDAKANFEHGKIKGMEEIWAALQWAQDKNKDGFLLMPIYGYHSMADCVDSLAATAFLRKTVEWQEKEARDIEIGDEVEVFDLFCPDDDPHSDIGIVVIVDSERHSFVVIGPKFEGCFDTTDIQAGNVRKTGRHFDSIPLDYLA